ncbi:arabinogalactan oligomer / maltooligosaccharide transport system substrate-binding protein [Clostridium sp. USBA 49]|uniref:sugar ABC transporter substrate-binding protein n=1 Tax=Clostridium sp. USBA 49 TaxID=1881060 RepID=UPI0009CC194B|nr:extracellular solute-binding protein [Clostridium sp. USBA 49]SKA73019.1 arabinogalactan oligomer / maltooligosaccharide transport system substrate-binding protein [Clostridium sp. USBA 49]
MKKSLAIILSTVLVTSLMTGCAKKPVEESETESNAQTNTEAKAELKPEEGASLVVWESEGAEGEYMKYAAQEFEKKYGVKVKYEAVDHIATAGKLQQDGPAGVGADVISAPHDNLGKLIAAGLIRPNNNPDRIKKDFIDAAVNGVSMDGTVYGYPTTKTVIVIMIFSLV